MIYVEKSALNLPLTKFLEKENVNLKEIDDNFLVEDKKSNIVITHKKDNFLHPCPATNIYRCCNYHVIDIMQGCPFDCSYCILQYYLPHKHIRVSADIDKVVDDILCGVKNKRQRIGTGELADSLALDNIIPISKLLTPIANSNDNIQLEFKTKSDNVSNLLNLNPKNIVVSWSLNPAKIINQEEPFTASLERRLKAASDCAKYGYKVAFHFDPLIWVEDFENLYGELINQLTSTIDENLVEFISVSTFRCPNELLDSVRKRKKPSILLKGDYIRGLDGKVRYYKALRSKMLKFTVSNIRKNWTKPFIYFCMEHDSLWKNILGYDPLAREEFEKLFPHYNCQSS